MGETKAFEVIKARWMTSFALPAFFDHAEEFALMDDVGGRIDRQITDVAFVDDRLKRIIKWRKLIFVKRDVELREIGNHGIFAIWTRAFRIWIAHRRSDFGINHAITVMI